METSPDHNRKFSNKHVQRITVYEITEINNANCRRINSSIIGFTYQNGRIIVKTWD